MNKTHDILNAYIVKNKTNSFCTITNKQEKNSIKISTEYQVLNYFSKTNTSFVKIILHTGKTHQIRAHMKYIGHNIIGDPKYGITKLNRKFGFKHQLLIAYKYSFNFNYSSPLSYLNNKTVKIPIEKINNFLNSIE